VPGLGHTLARVLHVHGIAATIYRHVVTKFSPQPGGASPGEEFMPLDIS